MSKDLFVEVLKSERRLCDEILMVYGNTHATDQDKLNMIDQLLDSQRRMTSGCVNEVRRIVKEMKKDE